MPADALATPPNPNRAETIDTMKNTKAQYSIIPPLHTSDTFIHIATFAFNLGGSV